MRLLFRYCIVLLAAFSALAGCAGKPQAVPAGNEASLSEDPEYLSLFEGLHVTGTPVNVDIASFLLKITGAVDRPLSLSYEQVRQMEAVREEITLECPGFFVDKGVWTGVPVRAVLDLAGVREGAKRVSFVCLDGNYIQALSLEDAYRDGMLIAYEFEGKPFHRAHGFPLRLAAKGKPGSVWVKWLGEIRVLE